jgi:hypothetical protein
MLRVTMLKFSPRPTKRLSLNLINGKSNGMRNLLPFKTTQKYLTFCIEQKKKLYMAVTRTHVSLCQPVSVPKSLMSLIQNLIIL